MTYQPPPGDPYQPPAQPWQYYQQPPPYQPQPYSYPPGFQPRGHKKTHNVRNFVVFPLIGLVVLIVIIAAAVGASGTKKSPKAAAVTTTSAPAAAVLTSAPSTPAPTPTPTPSPTQTVFPLGTAVPVEQNSGSNTATVNVLRVRTNVKSSNEFETPDNGQFVVADIEITGTGGSFTYNVNDFTVQTPDGRVWQSTIGWFDPALNEGSLASGQVERGNVTFDVEVGSVQSVQLGSGSFDSSVIAAWTP